MMGDIHRRFLEAGADIIETNTFGATSIGQSEFFVDDPRETGGRKDPAFYQKIIDDKSLADLAWEINEQSSRQCREWRRLPPRDVRPGKNRLQTPGARPHRRRLGPSARRNHFRFAECQSRPR